MPTAEAAASIPIPTPDHPAADKAVLRRLAREARDGASARLGARAGLAAAEQLTSAGLLPAGPGIAAH